MIDFWNTLHLETQLSLRQHYSFLLLLQQLTLESRRGREGGGEGVCPRQGAADGGDRVCLRQGACRWWRQGLPKARGLQMVETGSARGKGPADGGDGKAVIASK